MKLFKAEDYLGQKNPHPEKPYRPEILTFEDNAKNLGGILGILVPGSQVPYHYHRNRESVIMVTRGKAIEVIEGDEIPIQAGDVLFIPAGEKHTTINRSEEEFRYLEFFTCPPVAADFVEVK